MLERALRSRRDFGKPNLVVFPLGIEERTLQDFDGCVDIASRDKLLGLTVSSYYAFGHKSLPTPSLIDPRRFGKRRAGPVSRECAQSRSGRPNT